MNLFVFYSRKWDQLFIGCTRTNRLVTILNDNANWPVKGCRIFTEDGPIPETYICIGRYE